MAAKRSNQKGFDAGGGPVATVYAKALIGALEASGQTEPVMVELESLVEDCFDQLPQFEAALASPRVPQDDKLAMLDKAFQGRMTPILLDFLKVAAQHGRLDCLRGVLWAGKKLLNELRGRVEAELETATEIDLPLRKQIVGVLQAALGRPVDMTATVRPELIGGLLVRVGDSVYDASVVNQLRRVRDDVLDSTTQAIQGALARFAAEPS